MEETTLKACIRTIYIGVISLIVLSSMLPRIIELFRMLCQIDPHLVIQSMNSIVSLQMSIITPEFIVRTVFISSFVWVMINFLLPMFRVVHGVFREPGFGHVYLIFAEVYMLYCIYSVFSEFAVNGELHPSTELHTIATYVPIYIVVAVGIWAFNQ